MSFAEPVTITINAVPIAFNKRSSSGTSSIWSSSDNLWTLTISHQVIGKDRVRSMARLDQKKVVTNPLDSTNDWDTFSTWTVEERPAFGFSNTEMKNQISGFTTWDVLGATQDKILNQES
jgi:hypothetical protein